MAVWTGAQRRDSIHLSSLPFRKTELPAVTEVPQPTLVDYSEWVRWGIRTVVVPLLLLAFLFFAVRSVFRGSRVTAEEPTTAFPPPLLGVAWPVTSL